MPPEPANITGEVDLPGASAVPLRLPRILLVDDDSAVRASLKFTLELEDLEVDDFAAAEAAAEQANIQDYACLVLDYRLPAVDGLALLSLLRSRGCRSPAIIMTSNPTRKLQAAVTEADAVIIEKPLLCNALSSTIWELVDRHRHFGLRSEAC
jgi:two-component system response regulator FixJ